MTHLSFRQGLAFAGALFNFAVAFPVDAKKDVTLPTISVVGVDNVCDSFTVSTDVAGGTVLTCVPVNTPQAGAPTGCVAAVNGASTATLSNSGGNVSLAVGCVSPTTGLTYNWSRNGTAGASNQAAWTDTPSTNPLLGANASTTINRTSSYQVQVCAPTTPTPACVTVPSNPLTVTVPAQPTGNPPVGDGPWNGVCTGFAGTRVIPLNWANPTRMFTANVGGFGPNDAVVVQFTTGSVSSPDDMLPRIAAAEYNSAPSGRIGVLSEKPCDFSAPSAMGGLSISNSVTIVFAVGTGSNHVFYPSLKTNSTYYLNIRNDTNSTCAANSTCDMFIDLVKPATM